MRTPRGLIPAVSPGLLSSRGSSYGECEWLSGQIVPNVFLVVTDTHDDLDQ